MRAGVLGLGLRDETHRYRSREGGVMGIDVTIYAEGISVTDEKLQAAKEYIAERSYCKVEDIHLGKYGSSLRLWTGDRYYGEGYERGNWPRIYSLILIMRHLFPSAKIHYLNDAADLEELQGFGWHKDATTDEELSVIWAWWLSAEGQNYGRNIRAWNAKNNPRKDSE
jgi:hypothetical protein